MGFTETVKTCDAYVFCLEKEIMYYLVNVKLIRPNWVNDEFTRLVKANNKNDAWDKTDKYLKEGYVSHNYSPNKDITWEIEVQDTIE